MNANGSYPIWDGSFHISSDNQNESVANVKWGPEGGNDGGGTELSLPEIVAVSTVVIILSTLTAGGNLIVMMSFKMDVQLRTVSNYFLISLSIADFAIGAISMPLFSVYLLMQRWPFGPWLCDTWLAVDYTMSNASVANLLVISFDRYYSVTRPLTYRAHRTPTKAVVTIICAWIVSVLLWTPWIYAWPHIEGERTVPADRCYIQFLQTNKYITIVTAFAAFYLPLTIMAFLFGLIYRETKKRQKGLTELQGGGSGGGGSQPLLDKRTKIIASLVVDGEEQTTDNVSALRRVWVSVKRVCTEGWRAVSRDVICCKCSRGSCAAADDDDMLRRSKPTLCTSDVTLGTARCHPTSQRHRCKWLRENCLATMSRCCRRRWCSAESSSSRGDKSSSSSAAAGDNKRSAALLRIGDGRMRAKRRQEATHSCRRLIYDDDRESPVRLPSCKVTLPIELSNTSEKSPALNKTSSSTLLSQSPSSATEMHSKQTIPTVPSKVTNFQLSSNVVKFGTCAQPATFDELQRFKFKTSVENDGFNSAACSNCAIVTVDVIINEPTDDNPNPNSEILNSQIPDNQSGKIGLANDNRDQNFEKQHNDLAQEKKHKSEEEGILCEHPVEEETLDNDGVDITVLASHVSGRRPAMTMQQVVMQARATARLRDAVRARRARKQHQEKQQDRKAAKMLSAILLAFVVTWTPYNVFILVQVFCADCVPETMYNVGYWLCYINSTINPICYALCNANFRRTYWRILTCRWFKFRRPSARDVATTAALAAAAAAAAQRRRL